MITRFYSFEEASIYAGVMQSEGHYAVVLDNAVGFFYGPLFINGFRVLVSDEPVEEEEPFSVETHESCMQEAVRVAFSALIALGLLCIVLGLAYGLLVLLRSLSQDSRNFPGILPMLMCILPIVILPVLWAILGPLMGRMNRTLRDESSVMGWVVRGTVVAWVAIQLMWNIGLALMIVWWLIDGNSVGGIFPR